MACQCLAILHHGGFLCSFVWGGVTGPWSECFTPCCWLCGPAGTLGAHSKQGGSVSRAWVPQADFLFVCLFFWSIGDFVDLRQPKACELNWCCKDTPVRGWRRKPCPTVPFQHTCVLCFLWVSWLERHWSVKEWWERLSYAWQLRVWDFLSKWTHCKTWRKQQTFLYHWPDPAVLKPLMV